MVLGRKKMGIIIFAVVSLFHLDNREFFDTVAEQIKDYDWHSVECREVDPNLPSLTIRTPNGKELICHKLK